MYVNTLFYTKPETSTMTSSACAPEKVPALDDVCIVKYQDGFLVSSIC